MHLSTETKGQGSIARYNFWTYELNRKGGVIGIGSFLARRVMSSEGREFGFKSAFLC